MDGGVGDHYVKQEPSIWTEIDMSKSQNLQWAFASCGRGQPRHVREGCRQCQGLQLQWLFYSCPKSPGCKSKLLSSWNWPTPFPWDFEAAQCFVAISASTDSLGSQPFTRGDIRFLTLHNRRPQLQQLKTTCMCHPTVSMRQGSSLSLTRPPSQGLTGL